MTDDHKEYIRQWYEKADHDIIAATILIEIRPLILDVACFHCQQAVEKYLKAFLIYKGVDLEKTHNIRLLQNKCSAIDADFSQLDFKNLNTFAVDVRYPDFISPPLEEAKEYLNIAEQVKELVISKVKFTRE